MQKASSEQEAILIAEELINSCTLEIDKDKYIIPIQRDGLVANRRTSITGHWEVEFKRVRAVIADHLTYMWEFKSIKEH